MGRATCLIRNTLQLVIALTSCFVQLLRETIFAARTRVDLVSNSKVTATMLKTNWSAKRIIIPIAIIIFAANCWIQRLKPGWHFCSQSKRISLVGPIGRYHFTFFDTPHQQQTCNMRGCHRGATQISLATISVIRTNTYTRCRDINIIPTVRIIPIGPRRHLILIINCWHRINIGMITCASRWITISISTAITGCNSELNTLIRCISNCIVQSWTKGPTKAHIDDNLWFI